MDPVTFSRAFVDRAQRALAPPSAEPPGPTETYTPGAPQKGPDPRLLARQAFVVLGHALPAVAGNCPVALVLAAEVGRSLGHQPVQEMQARCLEEAKSKPASPQLQAQHGQLQEVFDRVRAEMNAEAELALWGRKMVAASVGSTVMVGEGVLPQLRDEARVAYTFAHELAHVENRDSAAAAGVEALNQVLGGDLDHEQWNLLEQQYNHTTEFAADRRAAAVVAKLGYDARPVLEMILTTPHDSHHPDSLKRARAVRQVFKEHGRDIPESQWKELLKLRSR